MARLPFSFNAIGLFSLIALCPTVSATPRHETYIAGHYVAASPQPDLRPAAEVARLACQLATAHPGAFVVRGEGKSMQPLYPNGTLLVIQPRPFETLARGMTVVFRDDANRFIAHVLVARTGDGWRTAGLNNRRDDYICVKADNIAGVVIAAYTEIKDRSLAMN